MLDTLCSGKLIKQPELKTSQNGKSYTNILLSVAIGESEPVVVSAIAFGDAAERIAQLGKGDAICVVGSLKPTEWADKATGETRHGLSVTVNQVLSVYDIKKRRPKPEGSGVPGNGKGYVGDRNDFNDPVPF